HLLHRALEAGILEGGLPRHDLLIVLGAAVEGGAHRPKEGLQVPAFLGPVGEGDVPRPLEGLGHLQELRPRLGLLQAQLLEDADVVEDLDGLQREGHTIDPPVGPVGRPRQVVGVEVLQGLHLVVQGHQVARLGQGLHTAVGPEVDDVGARAGLEGGGQDGVVLGVPVGDEADPDAGMLGFEGGDELVVRVHVLGPPAPEGQSDLFSAGHRWGQQHRQGQKESLGEPREPHVHASPSLRKPAVCSSVCRLPRRGPPAQPGLPSKARWTNPPASSKRCSAASRSKPQRSMTMATFTCWWDASKASWQASRDAPVTSCRIRRARSRSLALVGRKSTIRFWYTLPRRIMAPVERMLSTIFSAVPALSRVEPATASGPTTGAMVQSASASKAGGRLQVSPRGAAPMARAWRTAPSTKGVLPLALIPTTRSPGRARWATWAAPSASSSSASSTALRKASTPPARITSTPSSPTPKVGYHSTASRIPSRPLVPAPT